MLKKIMTLDYKSEAYKNVLKIKLTTDAEYRTLAAHGTNNLKDTFIKFLPGTEKITDTEEAELMNEIYTWEGNTEQVIMHLFATFKINEAKENDQSFPEIKNTREITGYNINMFNDQTKAQIAEVLSSIEDAYANERDEQ